MPILDYDQLLISRVKDSKHSPAASLLLPGLPLLLLLVVIPEVVLA